MRIDRIYKQADLDWVVSKHLYVCYREYNGGYLGTIGVGDKLSAFTRQVRGSFLGRELTDETGRWYVELVSDMEVWTREAGEDADEVQDANPLDGDDSSGEMCALLKR